MSHGFATAGLLNITGLATVSPSPATGDEVAIYDVSAAGNRKTTIADILALAGSGDVTAASTFGTDNVLIRSDGTGKGVQSSGITCDDSNNTTIPGHVTVGGGATASELRLLEPSGGGSSYTGFLAPALAGNVVYTLPTAAPAASGYLLSCTTANVWSWVPAREVLTAARTYYVRTDGSDSNTGLVDSAGGAFLTIQKAINTAVGLDLSIYAVTIDVGNGTYAENITLKSYLGTGPITILGDEVTLTNVKIAPASGVCVTAGGVYGKWVLKGIEINPATNYTGIFVSNGSIVDIQNLRFDAVTGAFQINCSTNALLTVTGNYTIAGSCYAHVFSSAGGVFTCSNRTVTLTGTPAWAYVGWVADRAGVIVADGNTFSGSATGKRYQSDLNSVLYTNGGGANYFPGNVAGSTSTGGQYV